jgi:membrane protein implicated in regulation of membrane protease activity
VLLAFIAIVFTLENSQQYSLAFFGRYLFPLSVGPWMILMLFMPATLGALLGVIVSLIPVYFGRYSVASKERRRKPLIKREARIAAIGSKRIGVKGIVYV